MKRLILIEGIFFVLAGYVILTNDYVYDSIVGASVRVTMVKYPLGLGLAFIGLLLIYSHFKKQPKK